MNTTREDRCPECGATIQGGRAGCQALWDEFTAQALTNLSYAAQHRLAFDTYCMQHLETYCRSAKSYAAHLMGLCCGLEHSGNPTIYTAIPRWLNGSVDLAKPAELAQRGAITLADVWGTHSVEAHRKLMWGWAENVWDAYAEQHGLARAWIASALGEGPKLKRRT